MNHEMDQDKKEKVIGELNRFLRGRYMGLHQYEQLIRHCKHPRLKEMLQKFQKSAKLETERIVERIKQLGGEPVDGVGILGEIRLWMDKLKGRPENTIEILHDAYVGENKYGVHMSHEMIAGDIDEESKRLIDRILEEDQKRADEIKKWLEAMKVTSVP